MKDRDFLIWIHERLEHVHGDLPEMNFYSVGKSSEYILTEKDLEE